MVVVVVTSPTASPLGTVTGTVVAGVGQHLGHDLHRHVVLRIGDEHDDRRLGEDVGDLADEPGAVDDGHADLDPVERATIDLDPLIEVAR